MPYSEISHLAWVCVMYVNLDKYIVCVCSVMSDFLHSVGLWPTRLLYCWDSPDKNIGVHCHFLLQEIFPTQGSNPFLLCLLHSGRFFTHWSMRDKYLIIIENLWGYKVWRAIFTSVVSFTNFFNRENIEEWWVLFIHIFRTLVRFYMLWKHVHFYWDFSSRFDKINCASAY